MLWVFWLLVAFTVGVMSGSETVFGVRHHVAGYGSRMFGAKGRLDLLRLAEGCEGRVVVDFEGVPLVSAGFVDEFLGKLVEELGFVEFQNRFLVVNMVSDVAAMFDGVVRQRLSSS